MMDKYEKIKVVGRGAYGTVFLCQRVVDRKLVIIKQIPVEAMTKEERQAALNEVKVLSMLDHPYIIEYYENFLEDKALMIVMEYAQGGTLFEYLQQRDSRLIEEEEIMRFLAQMLLSLQHVHSKQILHRDLKTQNILLDKRREVIKVGDFGISKVLSSKSKAYTVVGTPCYISPELCEGKPYNQKSDIWALGCVLYELASLKRAFEAPNLPALILKIMRGTFAPICELYSDDLRHLILSMLHLDPNKRPNINQIMAQPSVLNALLNLHTDFGKIPCRKIPHPMSGPNRGRVSRNASTRGAACGAVGVDSPDDLTQSKPPRAMCNVHCWGSGIAAPLKLPLPSSDVELTEVSIGRTQKAAVTKNGRLLVWEVPVLGSEGSALPGSALPGSTEPLSPGFIPRYLEGQSAVTIQHVACGDLFTACLTDRGILMTFGSGANGCLGHGNFNDVSQAKIVERLLGFEVVAVSCGASHVLAVTNEHEVFAWGRGDNGRLGQKTHDAHNSPQQVCIPELFKPASVHCGLDCSMVLTLDHQLLCCGSNRYNKLALDTTVIVDEADMFTPVQSDPIRDVAITFVSMGTSHSAVVTDSGECYMFGSNQFGQLGIEEQTSTDRDLHRVLHDINVAMVSCGDTFTVTVSHGGEVYSWGKAARGRLGRPGTNSHVPQRVTFEDDDRFTALSLSSSHCTTLLVSKPLQAMGSPVE